MSRTKFADFLDNHPLKAMFTIISASCSVTAAILIFFYSSIIDAKVEYSRIEVEKLKRELSGIDRGVNGAQSIDVSKVFIKNGDTDTTYNKLDYLDDLKAYTLKPSGAWQHALVSDSTMSIMLAGRVIEKADYRINKEPSNELTHHWWVADRYTINKGSIFKYMFPSILMRRYDYYNTNWTFYTNETTELPYPTRPVDRSDTAAYQKTAQILMYDFAGFSLMQSLQRTLFRIPIEYLDNMYAQLIKAEKRGNVMYTQYLWTLIEPTIDGKKVDRFYIRIEEISILSSEGYAYQISIVIPSTEPLFNGTEQAYISSWLNALRIAEPS